MHTTQKTFPICEKGCKNTRLLLNPSSMWKKSRTYVFLKIKITFPNDSVVLPRVISDFYPFTFLHLIGESKNYTASWYFFRLLHAYLLSFELNDVNAAQRHSLKDISMKPIQLSSRVTKCVKSVFKILKCLNV